MSEQENLYTTGQVENHVNPMHVEPTRQTQPPAGITATPNVFHPLNPGGGITLGATSAGSETLNPTLNVMAGHPDWQHFDKADVVETAPTMTNEPAAYRLVDVKPGENLADLARRVYGSNNVLNRLKIELANGGNVVGTIRVPK